VVVSAVLVDTTVYSHAMRGTDAAREIVQAADRIVMCPVVVGELLAGFRRGSRERKNRRILGDFLASARVEMVAITSETAEFYSVVYEGLREQGTPIPTNDIWIAACAMEHGARVATSDSHFRRVKGLILDLIGVR
jgi:predicted nucleic acid-binding protein